MDVSGPAFSEEASQPVSIWLDSHADFVQALEFMQMNVSQSVRSGKTHTRHHNQTGEAHQVRATRQLSGLRSESKDSRSLKASGSWELSADE